MSKREWSAAHAKVEREGRCRVCRSLDSLDPAHVVPRSLGGEQGDLAVIPLCRVCHTAYDSFRLDLIPFLTYEEQAEAVRVVGIERARRRLGGER